MKTWIRNLAIKIFLANIRKSAAGAKIMDYLNGSKTNVGRIFLTVTTLVGIAQYFFPLPFVNETALVISTIISWLVIELGLEDKYQKGQIGYDPTKEVTMDFGKFTITIPPINELENTKPVVKKDGNVIEHSENENL